MGALALSCRSNVPTMCLPWVRCSNKAINVSTLGTLLQQGNQCVHHGCVPPAGQRKHPHRPSSTPLSLQITEGACAAMLVHGMVIVGCRAPGQRKRPHHPSSAPLSLQISDGRLRCHVGSQRVYLGYVAPARQSMCPPWVRCSSKAINVSTLGALLQQDSASAPTARHPHPCPYRSRRVLALPCWFTEFC